MKKVLLIILILTSCSKINDKQEIQVEKEIIQDIKFIKGKYIEDVNDDYATIIKFMEDGTFVSNLNICNAMIEVKGEYKYINDEIYINFNEKTGFDFIDDNQPYIFKVVDNEKIQIINNTSYSCLLVDKYKLEK